MAISVIETREGKIEYTLNGRGKVILIVHGGHVNCREAIFQKGLDQNKYCLVTPSRPGYGATPLNIQNKTPRGTANLYFALLDQLNIRNVSVVGISAGGLTAIEMAANFPERVDNLFLMSALTKKWFVESDRVYRGAKMIFSPAVEKFVWTLYRLFFKVFPKSMANIMFKSLSKFRPVQYTSEELNELREMAKNMRSQEGFVNDLDQPIDQEVLAQIKCPTLILHSNYDNQVDLSHPQNAKSKIKNSNLMTFNNRWGHMLWFGNDYQPILKEFKRQLGDSQF